MEVLDEILRRSETKITNINEKIKYEHMDSKQKYKVIAVDADNTLYELNAKPAYERFFSYLSEKLNINRDILEKTFLEVVGQVKKSKNPEERKREYSLKKTLDKLGVKYSEELIKESLKIFWDEVLNTITPKNGVIEFIEKHKDKYIIVFTDEFKEIVEKKLEKAFGDWRKYFRYLITPEVTKEMKPSEKYYKKILEITKAKPEEIIVIGDSWEKDLKIAKDMGMKTVLISEEKQGDPDVFVKDFKELEQKRII